MTKKEFVEMTNSYWSVVLVATESSFENFMLTKDNDFKTTLAEYIDNKVKELGEAQQKGNFTPTKEQRESCVNMATEVFKYLTNFDRKGNLWN